MPPCWLLYLLPTRSPHPLLTFPYLSQQQAPRNPCNIAFNTFLRPPYARVHLRCPVPCVSTRWSGRTTFTNTICGPQCASHILCQLFHHVLRRTLIRLHRLFSPSRKSYSGFKGVEGQATFVDLRGTRCGKDRSGDDPPSSLKQIFSQALSFQLECLLHTVSATQTVSERCLRSNETSEARSRMLGGGKVEAILTE